MSDLSSFPSHWEVFVYRMTDEEFESAITDALDAMPEQFLEALNNVAVVWEEEPSA